MCKQVGDGHIHMRAHTYEYNYMHICDYMHICTYHIYICLVGDGHDGDEKHDRLDDDDLVTR